VTSGYRKYDDYGSARAMRPEEKRISFYNRYFIFRKNRVINAKQLKNSFLSYAGLQEEHARGDVGELDEESEKIALEKITRASIPIDVATKPAIAAEIMKKKDNDKLQKQFVEKPTTAKLRKLKISSESGAAGEAAAAAEATGSDKEPGFSLAESSAEFSAPIEQIEKSLKKRSRKAKNDITGESGSAAEQLSAGIENPIQPPKTIKIARKITKKVSSGTTDQPATGASAAASEPEKKGEAAAPKKTRKKQEKSDK
jgi:hypothetical protein